MSSPDLKTPPQITIYILNDMAGWHTNHKNSLEFVLGSNYNGAEKAIKYAEELEEIEKLYQANLRQDVNATSLKNAAIDKIQIFISSQAVLVKCLSKGHPEELKIYRDVIERPPSKLRSTDRCGKALTHLINGIEFRADIFDKNHSRSEILIGKAEALIEELKAVTKLKSKENRETDFARRDRKKKIKEVLDFIGDAKMAAMAVEFETPEPFRALRIIFETHLPRRFKSVNKLIEPSEDKKDQPSE